MGGKGNKNPHRGRKMTSVDDFLVHAYEIHGAKYDYSKVKWLGTKHKVEIICPEHGSFWQLPASHIRAGSGCPECGKIKSANTRRKMFEQMRLMKEAESQSGDAKSSNSIFNNISVDGLEPCVVEFCDDAVKQPVVSSLGHANTSNSIHRDDSVFGVSQERVEFARKFGFSERVVAYWESVCSEYEKVAPVLRLIDRVIYLENRLAVMSLLFGECKDIQKGGAEKCEN